MPVDDPDQTSTSSIFTSYVADIDSIEAAALEGFAMAVGRANDAKTVFAVHSFPKLQDLKAIGAEAQLFAFVTGLAPKTSTTAIVPQGQSTGEVWRPTSMYGRLGDVSNVAFLEDEVRRHGTDIQYMASDSRPRHEEPGLDPDQAWFWTAEWQQREREADADFAGDRHVVTDDLEAFLAELDS
jgi:hypothetical protein